jgi:hypothetical protein
MASSADASSGTVITPPWVESRLSKWLRNSVSCGVFSQRSRAFSNAAEASLRSIESAFAATPSGVHKRRAFDLFQTEVNSQCGFFGTVVAGRPAWQ